MLRVVFSYFKPHHCPLKRGLGSHKINLLLAALFGQPLLRPFQCGARPLKIDVPPSFGRFSQNRDPVGQGFSKSPADEDQVLTALDVGVPDGAGLERS